MIGLEDINFTVKQIQIISSGVGTKLIPRNIGSQ